MTQMKLQTVLKKSELETNGHRVRKRMKNTKLKSSKKDILKFDPNVHSEWYNQHRGQTL